MGLRRIFSELSDRKLQEIVSTEKLVSSIAEIKYTFDGGIDLELAENLCELRERATVAMAVGKERKLGGGPGSHRDLGISFLPNPKHIDSQFGKLIRRNRGVER